MTITLVMWTRSSTLSALPQPLKTAVIAITTERHAGRAYQHVELLDSNLGRLGFMISLPSPMPRRPVPVVFVLGALGTGLHNVGLIRDPGPNAIVGYDWPELAPDLRLGRIWSARAKILTVPGQMTVMARWVLAQEWADVRRVTLAGFSLGAIAAPAVEHVMTANGVRVQWTVLADGGAPISEAIGGDQHVQPPWRRKIAAFLGELLLRPMDPELHLAHLSGRFLVISSVDDSTISAAAAERLAQLTPEPKQIVRLPGGHVGTGGAKVALLDVAVNLTRRWLIAEGAIDA
jgi:pimeloyl-ACP methyl ester carboxylesterase